MAITLTNTSASTVLNSLVTQAEAGAGAPLVVIYSGTAPATAEAALSGNTVLAVVALTDPGCFTVSGKTMTMANAPKADNNANATGTATFFRVTTSTDGATPGTAVLQGSCGTSSADMILNTTSITLDGQFRIDSLTISLP